MSTTIRSERNDNPATDVADFTLSGGGSLFLLTPNTEAAKQWVEDHIGSDNGFQPYWPTVTIEHRYIGDIIEGIQADGLTVQ